MAVVLLTSQSWCFKLIIHFGKIEQHKLNRSEELAGYKFPHYAAESLVARAPRLDPDGKLTFWNKLYFLSMIVFCQVSAYSRLSFPSKPVSESLLERQWGTPISTVLAQEWLSWKTVSISLIFFTLYFSHSQKCWEKEVYRCLPIHVFPSSGISLLFPPSVCTLPHGLLW